MANLREVMHEIGHPMGLRHPVAILHHTHSRLEMPHKDRVDKYVWYRVANMRGMP